MIDNWNSCPFAKRGRKHTRSGGLGAHSSGGAHLDVEGGDADLLAAGRHVLGGKHRGVRGGLVTVGLHLHSSGHTHVGLSAGDVGHVLYGDFDCVV